MNPGDWQLSLGANRKPDGQTVFRVWAPLAASVDVEIKTKRNTRIYPLLETRQQYFQIALPGIQHGTRYRYILNNEKKRPDPVSRYLPEGLHGFTEIYDPSRFSWTDQKWKGLPLEEFLFYEMHVGTFTNAGTFDATIQKIPYLKKLGVTCIELMPVAQFPGKRNWGYDGAGLFAVQNSYGGPDGLKRLVNACHRSGLAVCLDVVYNHLGPEGNYLHDFGPYFTKKYYTPWGAAVNFDDRLSDHVRHFFVENALHWLTEYHIDALRLDAVHAIFDRSATPFLQELGQRVRAQSARLGRPLWVIAESDLNDPKLLRTASQGGLQLDAQWSDDFHHAMHAALSKEKNGYYMDFTGVADVRAALKDPFVLKGQYSKFRHCRHGAPAHQLEGERFVFCLQNHDQIGNRALGERLHDLTDESSFKAGSLVLLLAPYLPLLFMGQEYGEKNPFLYFVDHGDKVLREAVRKGRLAEFESFGWKNVPDPAAAGTFKRSKLNWNMPARNKQAQKMLQLYRDGILLRKKWGILQSIKRKDLRLLDSPHEEGFAFYYENDKMRKPAIFCYFGQHSTTFKLPGKVTRFIPLLDTASARYGGTRKTKLNNRQKTIFLPGPRAVAGWIEQEKR